MVAKVDGQPAGKPAGLAGGGGQPRLKVRAGGVVGQAGREVQMRKRRIEQSSGGGRGLQPAVLPGDTGEDGGLVADGNGLGLPRFDGQGWWLGQAAWVRASP